MAYIEFRVGDKFPLPIRAQGDGGIFQYDENGAMFILKLSKVDLIAIEAFKSGKIELGLFMERNIIFLLYKIEGIFGDWADCPYTIHFHEPERRPDFTKAADRTLSLYLVDSRLDVLLAMRAEQMSDAFYSALAAMAKAQLEEPFERGAYTADVEAVWRAHTSREMAARAEVKQELSFKAGRLPSLQ